MRQEFINWEEKEKKRERGEEINLFNFFCHFNSINRRIFLLFGKRKFEISCLKFINIIFYEIHLLLLLLLLFINPIYRLLYTYKLNYYKSYVMKKITQIFALRYFFHPSPPLLSSKRIFPILININSSHFHFQMLHF